MVATDPAVTPAQESSALNRHLTFAAASPPAKGAEALGSTPLPFTLLQIDRIRSLSATASATTTGRSSRSSFTGTPRSTGTGTEAELTSVATDEDRQSEAVDERGVLWEAHIMERGDLESTHLPSWEACQGLPLQMIMEQALWDKLSRHCQAVSRRCVARFFEADGLNLQGYLVALDHLFLMSHKDLLADFRTKLFGTLRDGVCPPTSMQATEWLHKSVVAASHLSPMDDLATAIFLHSFPGDDRPALELIGVEVSIPGEVTGECMGGEESETDQQEDEDGEDQGRQRT